MFYLLIVIIGALAGMLLLCSTLWLFRVNPDEGDPSVLMKPQVSRNINQIHVPIIVPPEQDVKVLEGKNEPPIAVQKVTNLVLEDINQQPTAVQKVTNMPLVQDCQQDKFLCDSVSDVLLENFTTIHAAQKVIHKLVTTKDYKCQKMERFGKAGDGGYELCMDEPFQLKLNNCLIYSFGIRDDWSFDDHLYEKKGCEVHSFDPSIGKDDHMHKPKVYFHNVGLWGSDFTNSRKWKLQKLSTIIKSLGHENRIIDGMKVDIESSEWPFLFDIVKDPKSLSNVKQIILEIHTPRFNSEKRQMSLSDYAQVYYTLTSLKNRLNFRNFLYHDVNNCCGRFTTFVPHEIAGKRLCCYETYHINSNFLR